MKLDRVKLERRRMQGVRLLQQNVPEAEVARRSCRRPIASAL